MTISRVYVLGMAGGIGSGKSTVAGEFRRLGAEVLDADAMVHKLLCMPTIVRKIVRRFGKDMTDGSGCIDRRKLGAKAFASDARVRDLEKILHPEVIRRTRRRIAGLRKIPGAHVVVIDAPLLFEAGMESLCDSVVFVQAPLRLRERRVRRTRGWNATELKRREKRQKPLDCKRRNAEFIIRNGLSRRHTAEQVRTLWNEIRERIRAMQL